jgi:NAD(P)-dependent dehydrogenase (short-subunit alcohol dehydrogenase family)
VQRAADETARALGKIDILVASAGITGPNARCGITRLSNGTA